MTRETSRLLTRKERKGVIKDWFSRETARIKKWDTLTCMPTVKTLIKPWTAEEIENGMNVKENSCHVFAQEVNTALEMNHHNTFMAMLTWQWDLKEVSLMTHSSFNGYLLTVTLSFYVVFYVHMRPTQIEWNREEQEWYDKWIKSWKSVTEYNR